jgi:hypothetical protein
VNSSGEFSSGMLGVVSASRELPIVRREVSVYRDERTRVGDRLAVHRGEGVIERHQAPTFTGRVTDDASDHTPRVVKHTEPENEPMATNHDLCVLRVTAQDRNDGARSRHKNARARFAKVLGTRCNSGRSASATSVIRQAIAYCPFRNT